MSKFTLSKRLDLARFKEGAYLDFGLLSFGEIERLSDLNISSETTDQKEIKKAMEVAISLLEEKFISGKLPLGEELVDVTKEDLKDLPIEILTEAMSFLSASPKAD